MGVTPSNVLIADIGDVIELNKKDIWSEQKVPAGEVLLDGGFGEVGTVVLHDRHRLATDGMLVIVMPLIAESHDYLGDPEIVTRGFIYVKDSEDLIEEMKQVAVSAVESCKEEEIIDISAIKSKVKGSVASFLFKKTKCSPIVLPVIFEV